MKVEEFWGLIEQSGRETHDRESRTAWLEAKLTQKRPAEIADFQVFLDRARQQVDTHDMWVAADQIFDGACSSDSFWYFQVWLIGLGRQAFEHAATDPDNLADLPQVTRLAGRSMRDWSEQDEWPEWETLSYVARYAFDQVTGQDEEIYDILRSRGHDSPSDPCATGERWDPTDPAELSRRLPRLTRLFPHPKKK